MPNPKKFLLIAPWDYQLYRVIEKNLIHLGYEVTVVHNNLYPPEKKSVFQKVSYFFSKAFSKHDNEAEKTEFSTQKRMALVKSQRRYAVTLVIRPDLFSEDLLKVAKHRSRQFLSFFYDGLKANPQVLSKVSLFDRFFVFDRSDVQTFREYGVRYAPNFYFDYPELMQRNKVLNQGYKIYYISSYHPSRIDIIQSLYRFITQKLSPVRFDLVYPKQDEDKIPLFVKRHFNCFHTIVPYEEQLQLIKDTEIILDFKMDIHAGFSFRIFDGIKLQKKVITTNPMVIHEDFYHPNNFFVLTSENEAELDAFLKTPYEVLPEEIRIKYSFSHWLRMITEQ
ncbi:hypothetical protein [Siphonobacter sp. SORGH_AS_1065]|uniref:hypothetical protein n=1 Tax=Siphonobacter sp. SORGH_AS_1065 TaxID=3041795 RepID=UPI0027896C31|nr:hypothetical protein [Siphonobacter sp. SORGH_AS_1065]MDQ1089668.1 hypothetical protein [Siphonobacter sp. SORGH_AS_1065]